MRHGLGHKSLSIIVRSYLAPILLSARDLDSPTEPYCSRARYTGSVFQVLFCSKIVKPESIAFGLTILCAFGADLNLTGSVPFLDILFSAEADPKSLKKASSPINESFPKAFLWSKSIFSNTTSLISYSIFVPRRGLEPPWIAPLAPKASASTNFATSASDLLFQKNNIKASLIYDCFEAWAGIEPAHVGFADRSVTTSPPRQYQMVS